MEPMQGGWLWEKNHGAHLDKPECPKICETCQHPDRVSPGGGAAPPVGLLVMCADCHTEWLVTGKVTGVGTGMVFGAG